MSEEYKYKQRMKILAKHLGDAYYHTGELHGRIDDAMLEVLQQQVSVEPVVSDDFGELMKIVNTNTKIVLGGHTMEDVEYMRNNRHKIAEWAELLDEINRWIKSQNSR